LLSSTATNGGTLADAKKPGTFAVQADENRHTETEWKKGFHSDFLRSKQTRLRGLCGHGGQGARSFTGQEVSV